MISPASPGTCPRPWQRSDRPPPRATGASSVPGRPQPGAGQRLARRGADRSDAPFVLVIDDYRLITAELVHRLVRFLIERLPPFVHLVVLTRATPVPLARLGRTAGWSKSEPTTCAATVRRPSAYLAAAGARSRPSSSSASSIGPRADRRPPAARFVVRGRHDAAALIEGFHGSQRLRPRLPRRRGARRTRRRPVLVHRAHRRWRIGSLQSCAASSTVAMTPPRC